jgi:hypothetical protein
MKSEHWFMHSLILNISPSNPKLAYFSVYHTNSVLYYTVTSLLCQCKTPCLPGADCRSWHLAQGAWTAQRGRLVCCGYRRQETRRCCRRLQASRCVEESAQHCSDSPKTRWCAGKTRSPEERGLACKAPGMHRLCKEKEAMKGLHEKTWKEVTQWAIKCLKDMIRGLHHVVRQTRHVLSMWSSRKLTSLTSIVNLT